MTTELIIIAIFCYVDFRMMGIPKHPQAKLYPSELVTIGILFALKGGSWEAFYRWLKRDYDSLFGGLPDESRLRKALVVHETWCDYLLAAPSLFTVIDSYPIELLFPIREGRSQRQIGRKGKDKGRWVIGIKLCWLLDSYGRVVEWSWAVQGTPDKHFNRLVAELDGQTITLADLGFRDVDGIPANLVLCAKGQRNERMVVETALSMVTVVAHLKHLHHRVADYLWAHLAYVAAMFNTLYAVFHQLHPAANPLKMSIAEFSL
jgi:hypothetical protein